MRSPSSATTLENGLTKTASSTTWKADQENSRPLLAAGVREQSKILVFSQEYSCLGAGESEDGRILGAGTDHFPDVRVEYQEPASSMKSSSHPCTPTIGELQEGDPEGGPGVVHVSVPRVRFTARGEGGCVSDREPSRGQTQHARLCHFVRTRELQPCGNPRVRLLVPVAAFAYAGVMYATAVVGGKVVRFKLSPALARAHRQNRGKAMREAEAVAFVETKRRARALRRARPYLASRP
jgi:hypothetical protein